MYFLRFRTLLITCILTLCFSCGGTKVPMAEDAYSHNLGPRKAYVVIRSEGGPANLQRVRDMLSSDFLENNVSTSFALYRAKQAWNQNEIFNNAYKGQFDYIVLIDQVAKFTIDGRTQVGGKYQIRSYHVKSPNPNWLDLGQSTCNVTVVPSIQKFSREVIRSIVGNQAAFKGHDFEYDDSVASTDNTGVLNNQESSRNLALEIEKLRKELQEEKQRTQLAEAERKKLENQIKLEVETQTQRAKIADIEAKDAALKKKERQREIAESYAAKKEEIRKREAKDALNKPVVEASKSKELTREERLTRRQETKKRLAAEKEAKRLAAAEAIETKKKERELLVQREREEQRRLKEELEAQRKEKKRLAEEDIKRIKAKVAEERRQAEALDTQKKEAEKLAKLERKEAARLAEELKALQEAQTKIDKEKADALAIEERSARRVARDEEKKKKEADLKAQRLRNKQEAQAKLADLEKQTGTKHASKASSSSKEQRHVYFVIRGKNDDKKQFEDLEDYIEFDFMFIKAKVDSHIIDPEQSVSLADIVPKVPTNNDVIIVVDQQEYLGNGKSTYQIMTSKNKADTNWKYLFSEGYNLDIKADLKQLSKKITEHLKN